MKGTSAISAVRSGRRMPFGPIGSDGASTTLGKGYVERRASGAVAGLRTLDPGGHLPLPAVADGSLA